MNEFRIFDRYKTPEEWKKQALEHKVTVKQKPRISTAKTKAAICAGAAAIVCAVALPVMDGISKVRQQTPLSNESQQTQEDELIEVVTSSSDTKNNQETESVREQIVETMREEYDNVVLGILLGNSEDGSVREVVAVYDDREELDSQSIISFNLNDSDRPVERLYINNVQTDISELSGIQFGDEVILGYKADENGVIDYSKASAVADFGVTNDEDFRHISKTADMVTALSERNDSMSVYYSEPVGEESVDADILNVSKEKLIRDTYANGAHSGSQIYSDSSNPFVINDNYGGGSGILCYDINGQTKRIYVMSVKANTGTDLHDLIKCGGSTYIGENPGFFTVIPDDSDPEIITLNFQCNEKGAIFGIKPDLTSTVGTVDYAAVVNDESFGDRFYYIVEITDDKLVTENVKFDIGYCEYELDADGEGGWQGNYSTDYRKLDRASLTFDYNVLD